MLKPIGNEDTLLADIDGDGMPEIIHATNNTLGYSKPDPKNPTGKWITTTITEPGPWGSYIGHGLGVGDINGDGLIDLVSAYGWFEHPARVADRNCGPTIRRHSEDGATRRAARVAHSWASMTSMAMG